MSTRSVAYLDDTLRLLVHDPALEGHDTRSPLAAAIRQLHDWTGEMPASTADAPPATTSNHDEDSDNGETSLTRIEANALHPDKAQRVLTRAYAIIDKLLSDTDALVTSAGVMPPPPPANRLASKLAWLLWASGRLRHHPPPRSETQRLERCMRLTNELFNICSTYRPPEPERLTGGCVAHSNAGRHALVERYTTLHLCRRCGDFRRIHGVNPPPAIIRLHDRKIQPTKVMLRNAGIKVA